MVQTFMSTCKWEETEHNLEQDIIKAASSHLHTLLDSFEAYFPSYQALQLKSKFWILNPFGKQQPSGPLGHIFKNDFYQQAFLTVENMLNFGLSSSFGKASTPGQTQTGLGPRVYSFTTPDCCTASIRCWQWCY